MKLWELVVVVHEKSLVLAQRKAQEVYANWFGFGANKQNISLGNEFCMLGSGLSPNLNTVH